jgi:hypothetical protein
MVINADSYFIYESNNIRNKYLNRALSNTVNSTAYYFVVNKIKFGTL